MFALRASNFVPDHFSAINQFWLQHLIWSTNFLRSEQSPPDILPAVFWVDRELQPAESEQFTDYMACVGQKVGYVSEIVTGEKSLAHLKIGCIARIMITPPKKKRLRDRNYLAGPRICFGAKDVD